MDTYKANSNLATFQYRPGYNDEYQKWPPGASAMCTPPRNLELSGDKFCGVTMYTTHFADLSQARAPGTETGARPRFQTYDIAATDPKLRALIGDGAYHQWAAQEAARSARPDWVSRSQRRATFGGHFRTYHEPAVRPAPPAWKNNFTRERR